jgi:hypothetical protein
MTGMSETNRKILNTLLAIDIGIIVFCMLAGHRSWLYTTQIGFFTSALVIAASMASYRAMIEKRLEQRVAIPEEERDTLDRIDDPHALYEEEVKPELQEASVQKQQGPDEEKVPRRSFGEILRDSRASLSFYRIGAYMLLVLGFFYLNRHHYLHIPSYLFSLSVPPVIVVILLMRENKKALETKGNDETD